MNIIDLYALTPIQYAPIQLLSIAVEGTELAWRNGGDPEDIWTSIRIYD